MKKLSILLLTFGFLSTLFGQTALEKPERSYALILGPNVEKALRFVILDDDMLPRMGYSLGIDYLQSLSPGWQAKISARYHALKFAEITYTPQFIIIGNIPVYESLLKTIKSTKQQGFELSAGFQKFGKPKKLRWFWSAEAGATVFSQNAKRPAFTIGLGSGWEWSLPNKAWAFSAQPILRGMLWGSQDVYSYHFVLSIEIGARHLLAF